MNITKGLAGAECLTHVSPAAETHQLIGHRDGPAQSWSLGIEPAMVFLSFPFTPSLSLKLSDKCGCSYISYFMTCCRSQENGMGKAVNNRIILHLRNRSLVRKYVSCCPQVSHQLQHCARNKSSGWLLCESLCPCLDKAESAAQSPSPSWQPPSPVHLLPSSPASSTGFLAIPAECPHVTVQRGSKREVQYQLTTLSLTPKKPKYM